MFAQLGSSVHTEVDLVGTGNALRDFFPCRPRGEPRGILTGLRLSVSCLAAFSLPFHAVPLYVGISAPTLPHHAVLNQLTVL